MMSSLTGVPSAPLLFQSQQKGQMEPFHAGQQNLQIVANLQSSSHPSQIATLSLEKLLDTAEKTGDLRLMGRNLKHFPKEGNCRKYNLRDTVSAGRTRCLSLFHF